MSYCLYISVGKQGKFADERFDQMFLNLVGNIFASREATLVFAIKANVSRYGRQENILNKSRIFPRQCSLRLVKALV